MTIHTPSSIVASLALSLTLFISVEANALSIGYNNENNKESSGTNVQLGANNSGDSTQFTGDKQVTINSPSSEDGNPSPNSPTVQASDPSMWDEQPHQDCVSDGGQIPDMNCIVNMISRPSQPQEPTTLTQIGRASCRERV